MKNNVNNQLRILRKEIDQIDDRLLKLLSKRTKFVERIGKIKKKNKIRPLDKRRWSKMMKKMKIKAGSLNLSINFIKKIFKDIHEYSLSLERKIE